MSHLPSPNNFTQFHEILPFMNHVTENWFGRVIILMIFIIAFIGSRTGSTNRSFAFASFIAAFFSIILLQFGIVDMLTVFITTIAFVASTAFLFGEGFKS
jgi:hypothetical protein|tara:strand:- start:6531 stop:6830 length:300 start_codon:yes stop_codon:yes gene_type:complete